MKRLIFILVAVLSLSVAQGQSGWTKKAARSIFTLKTFDAEGNLLSSSSGFFIGSDGEAVSGFMPFKGASRAVVIDSKGNEYPVASILGANSTYDVAKFRVEVKSSNPLMLATAAAVVGNNVWIMPYSTAKSPACHSGTICKVENFLDSYAYYSVSDNKLENSVGSPLFNDEGEVIGIMQQPFDKKDTVAYAVSVIYANTLKTNGLSINDASLNSIKIKKELPDELDQAILTLYVAGAVLDSTQYAVTVNDFISKFPEAADGYIYRAQLMAGAQRYSEADRDMAQALKVADKKDDVHFNYSKLIYQAVAYHKASPYEGWTLDRAAEEAREAYSINPVSVYRQLEAQILFDQKKYEESYNIYSQLFSGDMHNAETFFSAARCKEMMHDTVAVIALLDSAVNTFSKPYLKSAAPYLLARAQTLLGMNEYRKAVLDFNEYEKLMPAEVNANFYYIRARAEVEGHIYQAALNDFQRALQMEPNNTMYLVDKASLEIRVGLYDEAIKTSQQCVKADAKLSEGYLFLGLAQCLKGDKTEGVQNLLKAKDMGEPQAQELIDEYGK